MGTIAPEQKQENKDLSNQRIGVEHLIGVVKIFRVAADRFRLARHQYKKVILAVRHQYKKVILAVCGKVRVRINCLDLLTLNLGTHRAKTELAIQDI